MMEPGTVGVWDGERWKPGEEAIRQIIRDELATYMAAALADPDVGAIDGGEWDTLVTLLETAGLEQWQAKTVADAVGTASQHTAKSIAGYLLERVTETKAETT